MTLSDRVVFMLKLLKNHITGGRAPFFVNLATTFRCNLRCGYCYGQYYNWQGKDFTTEELFTLIDELAKLGTQWITLGGGEPLIRNDIGDIINRIKSHKMGCGMNTNGTLIPTRLNELKNIDRITVSFDGPKESNDANRGEGTYERIVAGIDAAIKAGIDTYIATVITRHNCKDIDWIVDFVKERGIGVEFNFLFNQAEGKHDSDKFMADNEAIRQVATRIADLKAQGAPFKFSEAAYRYVATWPDYQKRIIMGEEPDFKYVPCYAGRFSTHIDADGKFYPCLQLIGIFDGLDFRQVGVKAAWDKCAKHNCKACYYPCWTEYNYIVGLNPKVIWWEIKNVLKGHKS